MPEFDIILDFDLRPDLELMAVRTPGIALHLSDEAHDAGMQEDLQAVSRAKIAA